MPRSKHRRKPGGKSVRHPGRGRAFKPPPLDAETLAWRRMRHAVAEPFYQQIDNDDGRTGEMLDLVLEELWQRPVASRAELTGAFLTPAQAVDGTDISNTPEHAETAWAILVAHEIVVLSGDSVTVHPCIAQHFADAPAMRAQSLGQSASEASA